MARTEFDPGFSAAVRETLATRVSTPERRSFWRTHLRLGVTLGVVATVLVGGAAAASGILTLPGGTATTELSAAVVATESGTAVVSVGPAPEGATHVQMQLTCLSSGVLAIGGQTIVCSSDQVGTRSARAGLSIAMAEGEDEVTITASDDVSWTAQVTWVNERVTDWAVNDNGDTYGVTNESGDPELIGVEATNRVLGYVYATELADADGSTAALGFTSPEDALAWQEENKGRRVSIPVYASDGETVIGEFIVG